jgi:hypothetical protein
MFLNKYVFEPFLMLVGHENNERILLDILSKLILMSDIFVLLYLFVNYSYNFSYLHVGNYANLVNYINASVTSDM